ncbi:hypothetical protein D9M72_483940 [compost metagenome]
MGVDGTRLQAERAADVDVLSSLHNNGDCASAVRSVDLRFVGSKSGVLELSAKSADLGFTIIQSVQLPDGETAIDLSIQSDALPSSIDRLTVNALKIETRFNLRYDLGHSRNKVLISFVVADFVHIGWSLHLSHAFEGRMPKLSILRPRAILDFGYQERTGENRPLALQSYRRPLSRDCVEQFAQRDGFLIAPPSAAPSDVDEIITLPRGQDQPANCAWNGRGLIANDHEPVATGAFDFEPFRPASGVIGFVSTLRDDAF